MHPFHQPGINNQLKRQEKPSMGNLEVGAKVRTYDQELYGQDDHNRWRGGFVYGVVKETKESVIIVEWESKGIWDAMTCEHHISEWGKELKLA